MAELDYQLCMQFDNPQLHQDETVHINCSFTDGKAETRFGWRSCFKYSPFLGEGGWGRGFLQQLKESVDKDETCSFLGLPWFCTTKAK